MNIFTWLAGLLKRKEKKLTSLSTDELRRRLTGYQQEVASAEREAEQFDKQKIRLEEEFREALSQGKETLAQSIGRKIRDHEKRIKAKWAEVRDRSEKADIYEDEILRRGISGEKDDIIDRTTGRDMQEKSVEARLRQEKQRELANASNDASDDLIQNSDNTRDDYFESLKAKHAAPQTATEPLNDRALDDAVQKGREILEESSTQVAEMEKE